MPHNLPTKTLVIDDERYMRQVMSMLLTEFGLKNITMAADGEEALQLLDEAEPAYDLLICDLNMPKIDGIELLRMFAQRKFRGDIIIISASDKKTLSAVKNLGTSYQLNILGTLRKPISFSLLKSLLKKTHKKSRKDLTQEMLVTEESLKQAIASKKLLLYYQPQIDIASGQIKSMEALIRWKTENGKVVGPNCFIPLAESTGLIEEVSYFVFKRAFNQLANWNEQGLYLRLSINVSADDLRDTTFPTRLLKLARKNEIPPGQVMLELTESRIAENEQIIVEVLTRLHMHGFKLAIDDFGTGYSSLSQLTKIPFSEMKLDYCFVSKMLEDEAAEAIIDTSIGLANKLGLEVVAEGVENDKIWKKIIYKGCHRIQGFFLAPPLPKEEVFNWIKENNCEGNSIPFV